MNIDIDEPEAPLARSPKVLEVGAKLQQLRRERNWTLHDASRATGISVSTLSKIEREALSPTVTTLSRIANGFRVDAADLLSDGSGAATGRRSITRADDGQLNPTGTCDNVWLCGDLAKKKMAPIRTRVRARDVSEYSEWASYNAEIFVTVLSGTLVVHSDIYAPAVLHEGDSMYYDANTGHVWTSEGEEDAIVLWVHTQ
jgi:transcriptional regulator with XRE-family HTH domain